MEKVFDLNGREDCITAVITISDETFRIRTVVMAVRAIYANLLIEMGALLGDVQKMDESIDGLSTDEIKALEERATSFADKRMEALDKCLTLLLERNGYKYERAWWEEHCSESDMRAFIETCLSKDNREGLKKKRTPTA